MNDSSGPPVGSPRAPSRLRPIKPQRRRRPGSQAEPQPRARHLRLGAEGEARAARHLARRGYRIVARNVRAGGVELDLIAQRGSLLIFVEVKTRRSARFGAPELAVDASKRARLVRGAAAWLREHGQHDLRVRFDVIACELAEAARVRRWRLRHLEGAFDAGD